MTVTMSSHLQCHLTCMTHSLVSDTVRTTHIEICTAVGSFCNTCLIKMKNDRIGCLEAMINNMSWSVHNTQYKCITRVIYLMCCCPRFFSTSEPLRYTFRWWVNSESMVQRRKPESLRRPPVKLGEVHSLSIFLLKTLLHPNLHHALHHLPRNGQDLLASCKMTIMMTFHRSKTRSDREAAERSMKSSLSVYLYPDTLHRHKTIISGNICKRKISCLLS